MPDTTRNADADADAEADVLALVTRIENELLTVLERHTRMLDEAGEPRYSRAVAMHAVVDLAGRLMASAIVVDGERGRALSQAMFDWLYMYILPSTSSRPS
jgi:hypothetical protein